MKRLLAFGVLAALAACGAPPRVEVPPPDTLYRQLEDPLPRVDRALLSGYRILIDPGHGGSFRGTLGPDSLEEKQVNLGVGLYLWGLLREAGADAALTRAMDRDFLTASDSSLTTDLAARLAMIDSLGPDLFVSIHHNAQPARDPAFNRVETYYKAGDPASQDLATAVHRHLMRNLGIDVGEVRQGNYYVLRNARVPAILGESSYLTHPPVEEKLRLSRAQELEAQAYFLGIVDYCRRGLPRVISVAPAESIQTSVPVITAALEDRGGAGIDPDGVSMSINGETVDARLSGDGRRVVYPLAWDAPNGAYEVRVSVRNLRGNTSPVALARFRLDHAPALAALEPVPAAASAAGGTVLVHARIMDRRGLPVADGNAVTMTASLAGATPMQSRVQGGGVDFALEIAPGARRAIRVELSCGGVRFTHEIPVAAGGTRGWRIVTVRDAATGASVTNAHVTVGDSTVVSGSPSARYGFAGTNATAVISAPGYRPAMAASDSVELTPWFGGVLLGRRFVLDPQGGSPRSAGFGAMGLSSSSVNLRVAGYLAAFLRAAGAEVKLARTTEEVPLSEDVARATNRFRADGYLEIRHPGSSGDSALAVHSYCFPGSANGRAMASAIGSAAAARLSVPHRGPDETVTFPLQQTACPAVVIALPSIARAEEELRLSQAWYLREQAYALFLGVLAAEGAPALGGTLTVDLAGADRRDWMVTLDGTWSLLSNDAGRVVFEHVPPGTHDIRVRRAQASISRTVVTGEGQPAAIAIDAAAPAPSGR